MLRLAVFRGHRPSLTLWRGFAAAPVKPVEDALTSRRKQSVYYARITRKHAPHFGRQSMERVDRTARFFTSRGLSQTQALRAISLHVMLASYSHEMMESKVQWLSDLGLSHEKINDVIVRHPNILGFAFDRLDALVDWYVSHGVPQEKMAYVFNVFPGGVSLSIEENLDVKVDFLKEEVGCNYDQVARILTAAPQMLACSLERLQTNVRYLEELGVPSDKLPAMIALVPQCLNLKSTRIKETVDAMDEMFGTGAGVEALIKNCRIVMHNISGMRRSYNYLLSVGFTKERVEQNTRFLMRNANRLLRPRVQFLKSKGVDVVDDVSWILMSEGRFTKKHPGYARFVTEYKARLKKNR